MYRRREHPLFLPGGKLGFTGGMIAGLAGRMPHKIAMEMMLMARPMTAQRAYEVGFVNKVVPDGRAGGRGAGLGGELAEHAPLVLRTLKRFVTEQVLPKGPSELMGRADARPAGWCRPARISKKARAAWREKRKPEYKGR